MSNPIVYSSRTFNTIYNDINSDPELKDKPDWWKRVWAGVGDVFSMWLNAAANQSFLETAFSTVAVDRLLALIDYSRAPHSTSSGGVLFYADRSASFPFTVLKADLVAYSQGSLSVSSKRFEAAGNESFTAFSESFTANFTTDQLTVAHDYTTGDLVRVQNSGGALPAPLQAGVDYYVIRVDATHILLAETLPYAYAGTYIDLTTAGSGTNTVHLYSKLVTMYQRTTVTGEVVGTSDDSTWQEYELSELLALRDTIVVTINSLTWTRVDTFVYSTAADRHFKVAYLTDGRCRIQFGDGVYGMKPGAGYSVNVQYAYGGGYDSNIFTPNYINSYAGTNANITGVSNPSQLSGGSNREAVETSKIIAPMLLKARDRFVTADDGVALSLGFGGIIRANVIENAYGVLSAKVVIVPSGGGAPGATLKNNLQAYLLARTVLDSVDVRVEDPTYITTNAVSTLKISSGYSYVNVEPFYELAVRLIFSECTYEIRTLYYTDGIEAVVNYINLKWSLSFGESDYTQIIKIIENVEPVDFGDDIQESDVLGFLDVFVDGVDYAIFTSPTWPVTVGDDEISTIGTVTTTEIP